MVTSRACLPCRTGKTKVRSMTRNVSSFHWEDLSLLIIKIQVQLEEYEQWKASLPQLWVPKRIRLAEHRDVLQALIAGSLPLTDHVFVYKESFIAHQMSFFYHGELALRSALIDALFAMKNMFLDQPDFEQEIEIQKTVISRVADILVESSTPLLASIHFDDCGSFRLTQERITLCYARGICWALQQEKRVSAEHKSFTYRLENWIRQRIGIAHQ